MKKLRKARRAANQNKVYARREEARTLMAAMKEAGLDKIDIKFGGTKHETIDNILWFMGFELSFHRKECELRRSEIGVVGGE